MVFHENDSTYVDKGKKEEVNIVSYSRHNAGIHEGRLLLSMNRKVTESEISYISLLIPLHVGQIHHKY